MALTDGWSPCCYMNLKTTVSRMYCCPVLAAKPPHIVPNASWPPSTQSVTSRGHKLCFDPLGSKSWLAYRKIPWKTAWTWRIMRGFITASYFIYFFFLGISLLQLPQGAGTTKWQKWKHWAPLKCSTSYCQILSLWRASWCKVQLSLC